MPKHSQGCFGAYAYVMATLLLAFSLSAKAHAQIVFNQLGFLPNASKIAVVPNVAAGAFYLVDESNNTELLRGPLGQPQQWAASGQTVKIADFTAFNKPGRYRLRVDGVKDSAPFTIGDTVYSPAVSAVARSLYFLRAGAPLSGQYAGPHARASRFADLLVQALPPSASEAYPSGSFAAFPKGWLNGADSGKNVIATTQALVALLHLWHEHSALLSRLTLNIPESTAGSADLLHELGWGLDWLQSMQDIDGGVYHAVNSARGAEQASDLAGRALMPKSTAATLSFAAVMARAAKAAQQKSHLWYEDRSRFQQAAENAWQWAQKNKKVLYSQPAGYSGEPYALVNETLEDEWLWAAAELWALTGKKSYLKTIKLPASLPDATWQNTHSYGLFALAENPETPPDVRQGVMRLLTGYAHNAAQMLWQSGYMVPMQASDFQLNSNGLAVARAMVLLKTNQYAPNKEYEPAARALLDYVFGRNPLGRSFVTGLGEKPPTHVEQNVFSSSKSAVPGFLVAGPAAGSSDKCDFSAASPALHYVDAACARQTNSIDLSRQGQLLYTLVALNRAELTLQ